MTSVDNPSLLALDTATEQCSVAVCHAGHEFSRCVATPRGHADMILPMIQEVMSEAQVGFADLHAIAFGRGPGAFTGVRIAIGVAQGLAYASHLPLLPVSNLAVVAQQVAPALLPGQTVLVCMDARMNEVYTGLYVVGQDGLVLLSDHEQVCSPEQVPDCQPTRCLGTGFRAYPALAQRFCHVPVDGDVLPRAVQLLPLAVRDYVAGKQVAADQAAPVYLRDRVTHVNKMQ